ncbi:MAG: DNA mismatch repair protein MutS [Alphaproteobacteria bacterium]|nr:DNA mismatch repair protein MutS [Alphaproteobacteria bacterium]
MDEKDERFWREYARGIKPLKRGADARKKTETAKKPRPAPRRQGAGPAIVPDPDSFQHKNVPRVHIAVTADDRGWQLDRNIVKKLRVGRVPLEARIDLHGMTRPEAYEALKHFIAIARRGAMRCVLVITGKSGVLRADVPRWLRAPEFMQSVIGAEPAAPRHGGNGALYVVLRRGQKRAGRDG